jgi:hypothetical protein
MQLLISLLLRGGKNLLIETFTSDLKIVIMDLRSRHREMVEA